MSTFPGCDVHYKSNENATNKLHGIHVLARERKFEVYRLFSSQHLRKSCLLSLTVVAEAIWLTFIGSTLVTGLQCQDCWRTVAGWDFLKLLEELTLMMIIPSLAN